MNVLVALQYVQWGGSVSVEEEVKGGERQLVTAHCSQVPQLHKQIGFTTGNTSGLGKLAAHYRQTQDPDSITVSPFTHNESETSRLV